MTEKRKTKEDKPKPGPEEERLKITDDPLSALRKLFRKPDKEEKLTEED